MKEKTTATRFLKIMFAMIMSMVIVMTGGIEAFALGEVSNTELSNLVRIAQQAEGVSPNDTDILTETFDRGAKAPTSSTNLPYSFSGTYKVNLYTNYYFKPNSAGQIHVSATTTWPNNYTIQKEFTATLYKYKGGAIKTVSGLTNKTSNGKYSQSAKLSYTFYGLDKNSYYYVYFSKTTDSISAGLSGKVSQTL